MLNDKILRQDTTAGDSRSATVACVFKVGLDKNLDGLLASVKLGGDLYRLVVTCCLVVTCVPNVTLRKVGYFKALCLLL